MSLQTHFIKFAEKIRLTWQDNRLKKIREKDESLRKDIRNAFKAKGYPVQEFFQQGSYATKTTIFPLDEDYDIDVAVVIDDENAPDEPVEPKKTIKEVLEKRNFKEPKIKLPCVTAQYYKSGEKHFHLDYPIYKKESENYYLAVGKEHSSYEIKKWEEADPKGLLNWLNDSQSFADDKAFAQYKRLIMYLKRWRDFKISGTERKKVYSIGLAIIVRESFQKSISSDGDISDILSLKATVDNILHNNYFKFMGQDSNGNAQYEIIVKLPVKPYRNVFDKHGKSLGSLIFYKLEDLSIKLEEIIKKQDLCTQCEMLRKHVFGDDFPECEHKDNGNKKFKEAGFVASPQGA